MEYDNILGSQSLKEVQISGKGELLVLNFDNDKWEAVQRKAIIDYCYICVIIAFVVNRILIRGFVHGINNI